MSSAAQAQRILIAMSGGPDSAVTAALLKSQGHELMAVHFRFQDRLAPGETPFPSRCCARKPREEVARVCAKLDVPLTVLDLQDAFEAEVIDFSVHETLQQRMPNPCLPCNRAVKLKALAMAADQAGCSAIATGHYARVAHDPGTGHARLYRAADADRDQSHLLFDVPQAILSRLLTPLGGLPRTMVLRLAQELGLPIPVESVPGREPCLTGNPGWPDFVEARSAKALRPEGVVRTLEGRIIGEHKGLHRFRIGQTEGLKLDVEKEAGYCVVAFDESRQILVVGPESALDHSEAWVGRVAWVRPVNGIRGLRCRARIRAGAPEGLCHVTLFENDTVHVRFDEPQRAMAAGQSMVFYNDDEVVGGGLVERVGRPL